MPHIPQPRREVFAYSGRGPLLLPPVPIVRDKEGDLKDTITFYRKYFNVTTMVKQDSFLKYNLDNFGFPEHDEIEVQLLFSYGEDRSPTYLLQNTEPVDRDLVIGVIVKDKAGNRSDYVETNRITLKKP